MKKEFIAADEPKLTPGEIAVSSFQSGDQEAIERCKDTFAAAISQMHYLRRESEDAEVKRMCSVAITEATTAQMWAVRALSYPV